jgi:hypothetical protein
MRAAWLVLAMLGAGEAAEAPPVAHGWQPMGYQGFVESIDALVGPEAVDCGFFRIGGDEVTARVKRQAYQCVQSALKARQPFKFGTFRIPIDSYAHEILARSSRGELWQITYDVMLTDDETGQQWNQICNSVSIDKRTLLVLGTDCVSQPDGRLNP